MENRYSPIRTLAWLWGIGALLSALSVFYFDSIWPAQTLLFTGIFASIIILKRVQRDRNIKTKPLELGHASACIWQLDREA